MSKYEDAMLICIQDLKDEQHRWSQNSRYQNSHPSEWMVRLQTLSFCICLLEARLEYLRDKA